MSLSAVVLVSMCLQTLSVSREKVATYAQSLNIEVGTRSTIKALIMAIAAVKEWPCNLKK